MSIFRLTSIFRIFPVTGIIYLTDGRFVHCWDGVDIYFLNREPIYNVRNSNELANVFAVLPEGTGGDLVSGIVLFL